MVARSLSYHRRTRALPRQRQETLSLRVRWRDALAGFRFGCGCLSSASEVAYIPLGSFEANGNVATGRNGRDIAPKRA